MKLNEILQKISQIKKGKFTKATWKSEKVVNGNLYEKVSHGVVRFVHYYNIKGVSVKVKTTTTINNQLQPIQTIVKDILTFNPNTNNYLVHMATTNHHKSKSEYYCNGKPITKEEYEQNVPPRKQTQPMVVFQVKLENLISLG